MAQKVHIPNFKSIPKCNFLAIAEVRSKLGKKVQDRYGDTEAVLEPSRVGGG